MAQLANPVLTHDDIERMPDATRDELLDAGLLVPHRTAQSIMCDACAAGHAEEVETVMYPNGRTCLFIYCPENGRLEIEPDRLRQWRPRYGIVAELIADSLDATGGCREILPERLWDIGRAAVAGQSRPVWLARRLTAELIPRLPADKVSLLFILGNARPEGLEIAPERVFEVRRLVRCEDGELSLDADAVRTQLGEIVRTAPPKKRSGRRTSRAAAIDSIKKHLREQILIRKSTLSKGWNAELEPLEQKYLAELAGVHESTVSRILREETQERELQILWQIVNDPEQIMRYQS
jgi:hypothetical protein